MKKKLKIILLTCVLTLIGTYTIDAASVSILSWYLNGDNGELRYYIYNSNYSSETSFASRKWNEAKSGIASRVYDSSIADVIISDVNISNTSVLGTTDPNGFIRYNRANLEKSSSTRKKHVAIHEMGHALGLAHNSGSRDVMKNPANDATFLTSNDKASLEASYSRYRKWEIYEKI